MHAEIAGKLTGKYTKWIVLIAIMVAASIFGGLAGKLTDVQDNQTENWLPASAESTKAIKKLNTFQDEYDISSTLVYYKKSGLTTEDLSTIDQQATEISELDGLTGDVISPGTSQGAPFVSEDGQVAKVEFTANFGDKLWEDMPGLADDVRDIAKINGAEVYLAGAGGTTADQSSVFSGFEGKLLLITLIAVILILLFSYRSPILWILPIFSAVVGLGITMGLLYLLAKNFDLTVNGQTQFIVMVLTIGAGTDYALLLVARYREELRRHQDRHEAMAFALHRAAPAILASAATVVVGLLCLLFADMNSTAGLGPANAIAIAVTYVVMVTLLPALLVIFGRWVFWPFVPRFGTDEPTASGFWARVGGRIAKRPRAVWLVTAGILVLLCLGFFRLDTSGVPSDEVFTNDADSVTGQELLVSHRLIDASTPIQILTKADKAEEVSESIAGIDGIDPPREPIVIGDEALINVDLTSDPVSDEAKDTVHEVRDAVHQVDGADALVAGWTAVTIDMQDASARDDKVIIPIVLVAVLLILILLLRALFSPLLLIGTVILSFGAAIGISGLVFDFIYDHHYVDPGFPLFAFVFLVALGIDYNIFLMSRVREETINHGTRKGSLIALSSTGGVITSAGLVLAATFSALATMPITFTLQLGTTIALGVLLDTLIVRSVLVTAINLDIGDKIWWPSKLARGKGDDAAPPGAADEEEKALV